MLGSVSTSARSSGAIRPVTRLTGSTLINQLPNVDEVAGHRCSGSHRGAHQMRATAGALPPFKVAIARRCASLARGEDVRVHAQAHRTARVAPFEPGGLEYRVNPFLLSCALHCRRPTHPHRAPFRMHILARAHLPRRTPSL